MATHSTILAWRIPRTEEPGGLPSMGFPRQDYWSGLPFPSPGDLPNSGIESGSPVLAGRFFTVEPPGKPISEVIILASSTQMQLFVSMPH